MGTTDETLTPQPPTDEWKDTMAQLIAGAPLNLVSRADRSRVRTVHVEECVAIGHALALRAGAAWLDLGTGGGLPGLVLAGMYPDVDWTLLDARSKKLRQVEMFARALGLANVTVVHGRAEDLADQPTYRGALDGVISRAVGSIELTVALSRGFVVDGTIVAVRGADARAEAERLGRWCDDLGVRTVAVTEIGGTMRATWLIHLRGLGPPPARFPRARRQLLRSARGGTIDGSG